MKKTIFIVVLGIAIVGGVLAWTLYNRPIASFESATPAYHIIAEDLYAAFSDDEIAAGNKYIDTVVEVTGKVVEKLENSDGSTTIILRAGHPIFGVKCRLDPSTSHETVPDINHNATIKGLCIGMNSDVELERCVVISTLKP